MLLTVGPLFQPLFSFSSSFFFFFKDRVLLCTPGDPQTFSLPFSLKVGSQACITETAVKTKAVKGSNDKQRAGTTKMDNARPREVLIFTYKNAQFLLYR